LILSNSRKAAPKTVDRDTVISWAVEAARIVDDKKGNDTRVLDVGSILSITDVFVITSASNGRLVRTLAEQVDEQLKERFGIQPIRIEGMSDATWVLLDYGDVVVHVFSDEMRAFYEIERLYRDAPQVSWELAAGSPPA
jgi:ribosome-associated protein